MSQVTALKKERKEAYYELFQTYHDRVFNFISKYAENQERAKDLTYKVFLQIWQSKTPIHHNPKIEDHIYELSRDAIIKNYRHRFLNKQDDLFTIQTTKKRS